MLNSIILIIACVLMVILTIYALILTQKEKKAHNTIKKELNEVYEHEERTAEIISNSNKTKADARTGDHSADIKYMADKLHDYANK